jgi:hypothetical protein
VCVYIFYLYGIVAHKRVSTQFKSNATSGVDSVPTDPTELNGHMGKKPPDAQNTKVSNVFFKSRICSSKRRECSVSIL